jgi:hypothetical protein
MKRILPIIILIIVVVQGNAQSIKRGYKSLEKLEYDKAKEVFDKALQENSQSVAANLGVALILADDKSPLFDIVGSWKYVEAIKGHENELTQEEIDIIGEYFMNTEVRKTSRPVKKKIEIAEDAIEARLIKYIREENNLDAVYKVLELYPNFKYKDNVTHIRNQFEFRKYEKQNTLAGYEEFIAKFPDAAQVPKALKYCNKMAFDEVKIKNTVNDYNLYIKKYPNSEFLQQTIKLRNAAAYADVKKKNTLEAYEDFIKFYPDALEIPDARKQQHQLMYEKAKRIKTLEMYNQFISMYPDGAYYIDVFNLKAGDLGMQEFRQLGFESPDLKWAKALDNNQSADNAKTIANSTDGSVVVAGTSVSSETGYSDVWIVKLDGEGKMVWNKTVGQAFNDEILKINVTPSNEIIGVGYTQTTSDSNSFAGWMFKLGSDGKKIWNKSLGDLSIASSSIDATGKIYIATYINDTIPDKYYFQIYNEDGTKVGERDYTKTGTFNDMLFTADGNSFLAGSRWFICSDPKFYIKWEDTLSVKGSIVKATANNQMIALAAVDGVNRYLMAYSIDGKKLWSNFSPLADSTETIEDILLTDKNELIVIGNNNTNSYACKYDIKGSLMGEKKIFGKFRFADAIKTSTGGVTYLFKGDDFLVVSFASTGF